MNKNFAELHNVEIFRTGTWNGDRYSDEDLEMIATNFQKLKDKHSVPVKLGHSEKQSFLQEDGLPAAGWISNVQKVGDKLIASIKDVPQKIFDLVKGGAYKKVSAEIYPAYKDAEGNRYSNVLRALALLGSDIPAVEGLKDMQAMGYTKNARDRMQAFKSYAFNFRLNDYSVPISKFSQEQVLQFNDQVRERMLKYGENINEATIRIVSKGE